MPRHRQHGFTLIEVTAAIAIAGIALVGLMRLQLQSIASADRAHNLAMATRVAQDKLNALQTSTGPQSGTVDDENGTFHWEATTTPSPVSIVATKSKAAPQTLRVRVWWEQGRRTRAVELSTLRSAGGV